MSAQPQRNGQQPAYDSEWLEFPDSSEISAASVWAPDYQDEITIQSRRVAARQHQELIADTDSEPSMVEARPRALMLDESHVLPSEASFATVKLHQQGEPTAVTGREQLTTSAIEETTVNRANSRTRTLDASHVLPGEVSYATVIFQPDARTYSPLREFFATSNLDWRKLTVEALLLVSISAAIATAALKFAKPGVFSSKPVVSNSADISRPQTEPTVIQTESPTSNSVVSAAVSNQQTQLNEATASAQNPAKLAAAAEVTHGKASVPLDSEGSRIAASDEIKLQIPRKIPQQEGKSRTRNAVSVVESSRSVVTQKPRPNVKESATGNRATPTERVGGNNPRSQAVEARRESPPVPTNVTSGRPKAAATSAPVTGGGQRPRTVTPKVNP